VSAMKETASAAVGSRPHGSPKILVVDDNPANRLGVRKALRGIDVELHEVDSGFDALSLSLVNDYALVLLDVQMPDMDGFEICAQLRSNPKTAETPIVLMTAAYTSAEDAITGYAEGATDYLAKPVSDRLLRAKVQVFLRLFRQRQALQNAIETADRAKAEAECASLARSKFLAAASHDLRQPVQAVILLLGVLKRQMNSPQIVADAVSKMEVAAIGLNKLLNSMLDVSQLDAGAVMPQIETVDAGHLLTRLSQEYSVAAVSKGLSLKCFSRSLHVRTDSTLLERAMRNVIENALRYTLKGGILLGLRRRGDRVRFDVIDTGIGISSEHQPYIFEEFYQADGPTNMGRQGLGLGLSIVSRICRLLGAEILLSSREGRGTRFSVLFPLDESDSRPTSPLTLSNDRGGCILVIEDNPLLRSGLEAMLQGWGYEVIAASSGEEAIHLGESNSWGVDAIITDQRLGPGLTGTAAAMEIRTRAGRLLPTLVITGDTDPALICEVRASGFVMLHKPIGVDELRNTIGRLMTDRAHLSA
jgi:signal transduction histidine kinase